MSQLNSLLESANPYKSLQGDAARLANKWSKTGLLEGLGSETDKNNMSMILENQAKQLVTEVSTTGGGANATTLTAGTGAQWAGVALPLVRKVFGQIAAKEFVSVQPMNLPSGLVFFLDFQYGNNGTDGFANNGNNFQFPAGESLYGDGITELDGGTSFGNTNTGGLYGAGRYGYSQNWTSSQLNNVNICTGAFTDYSWYNILKADSSFCVSADAATASYKICYVKTSALSTQNWDKEAVNSFYLSGSTGDVTRAEQYPAFTQVTAGDASFDDGFNDISFTFVIDLDCMDPDDDTTYLWFTMQPTFRDQTDFEEGNTNLNGENNPITIPQINVQMKSEAIVAKTRKLKAVWTPEFAQDLNAYHSLDAEAELTSIMSEYISLEIDLEILEMLIEAAAAGDEWWSAINNTSIGSAGANASLGFYNSQGQWFQTLGTKIQKLSNIIHQKTLRGGANFLVCSPTVATILESIPGFASNSDGDVSKASYAFGVQKAGTINSRYTVYKNPYMTENTILLGYRGGQFLEAGAVFAPYIPLIMTPLVYEPDTFTPRKGLLTRYAKKVVRPEFYGRIYVSGLNTL